MDSFLEPFALGNAAILGNVCMLPLYPGMFVMFAQQSSNPRARRWMPFLGLLVLAGVLALLVAVGGLFHVLNAAVAAYTAWGTVERTLTSDLAALKAQYPAMVGLVVFPQLTADSILSLAAAGRVLPAGVTRFVVPGRILRINIPLDFLRSDQPLVAKSDRLDQIVQEKLAGRRIRYYQEPVVLLDE